MRFALRYAGWVLVGASGLLSFFAGFSFGLFVLPGFFVLLLVMVSTKRPEDLSPRQYPGLFLGMAMVCSFVLTVVPEWWPLYPIALGLAILAVALPLAGLGLSRGPEPRS